MSQPPPQPGAGRMPKDGVSIGHCAWYSPSTGLAWTAGRREKVRILRRLYWDGENALKISRVAWAKFNGRIPRGMVIDHINRNSQDNRLVNLRCVSVAVNNRNINKRTYNTSGLPGVTRSPRGWRAQISVNNRKISLVFNATKRKAYAAYLRAKSKYHGAVSILGLPRLSGVRNER